MKTNALLRASSVCCLVALLTNLSRAENWPQWRGPKGTGVSSEKNLPLHWSTDQNVRWKTPLPAKGNSTPVVWGERVFVTQAVEGQRSVFCFDRNTGRLRWKAGVPSTETEISPDTNHYNSCSPVTDGKCVVVWYGSAGVYCYDLNGNERWHRDLGPQRHIWGWGSSPVLAGGVCLLNIGRGAPRFIVALDTKN